MTDIGVGFASIGVMVLLIYAGMYVPVALSLISFLGVWWMKGNVVLASKLLAFAAANTISSYLFGVVPLFVLMGLLVSVSDIGKDTFEVANQLFRRIKGGLGIATVAANTVFAAITGISIASAAVFTKVAVPEMTRHGYNPRFAVGIVAGSSVLGMLIPPSLLLIIYGVLSEQSVGDLFLAGVLPGLVLAAAYAIAIPAFFRWWPSFTGLALEEAGADAPRMSNLEMLWKLGPVVALVALVLGGIYGGLFTPTEAGAVGALGSFLLALTKRRLTWPSFWRVLVESGHITAAICLLIIAASMYSQMLTLSGITSYLGNWIASGGLSFPVLLTAFVVVVLALGTILDSSSIMLITLPLVLPVIAKFGVDLVWFGIVTVIAVEIGLLTPPFGISVYVIKATLDDQRMSLNEIFAGALPFAAIMFLVLLLVIFVPWLSLALIR
ncbi:MAG: TRAP transporter large permease [Rhodospirillales bacterium]|nr:TRAP transporter large permease [Rhodospirillales bacterium]